MFSNLIKALIATVLAFFVFNLGSYAMTAEEYCQIHKDAGAPGTCVPKEDCAILTTNLGTEECKLCEEGGCTLTDCSNCAEE